MIFVSRWKKVGSNYEKQEMATINGNGRHTIVTGTGRHTIVTGTGRYTIVTGTATTPVSLFS